MALHETLTGRSADRSSSDRGFGLTFATVFALAAAYFLLADKVQFAAGFATAAVLLTLVAIFLARILAPANRAWTRFGLALHRVISPLIMGAMFYGVFTPMGIVMRLFGFDPLTRKRRGRVHSYWMPRDPEAAGKTSMTQQF